MMLNLRVHIEPSTKIWLDLSRNRTSRMLVPTTGIFPNAKRIVIPPLEIQETLDVMFPNNAMLNMANNYQKELDKLREEFVDLKLILRAMC